MSSESETPIVIDDELVVVEEQTTPELTPEEKQAKGLPLTLSEKRAIAGRKGGLAAGENHKEKRAVLKQYQQKILGVADVLFRESLHNARGRSFLYKIEKEAVTGPRGGVKYVAKKPALVTSEHEIEEYLSGVIENGDLDNNQDPEAVYYFITTERGDQRAIDSMLDRAFGRATQVVQTEDDEGNRQAIQGNTITFIKQDVPRD